MKLVEPPPFPEPVDLPLGWPGINYYYSDATSRFIARFRAASQFEKAIFSVIRPETADGYSKLIKFSLVYSAWEQMREAFDSEAIDRALANHSDAGIRAFIDRRLRTKNNDFFDNLKRGASDRMVTKIDRIQKGDDYSVIDISTALRNAFSHGDLTPNAKGGGVPELAELLSDYLLQVMRVEAHKLATDHLKN